MSKLSGRIYNLESLDSEIRRLQSRTRALEKEIDQKMDHLQDNYSSMIMKSFLPAFGIKSGLIGTLLQVVLQNRRLQDSVGRLTDQVFDKISDAVEFVATKLEGKKKAIDSESSISDKS